MKRTTILLPDDLAYLIDRERRRRGVSTAVIVREAVAAHFNISSEPRHIPFAALGSSGLSDIGENFEQYLDEAWGSAKFYEETMGHPPPEAMGLVGDPAPHASPEPGSGDIAGSETEANEAVTGG